MRQTIDLDAFTPVRERVQAFYARFPLGSIRTELVRQDEGRIVFRAAAQRDPMDRHPVTGWAYDRVLAWERIDSRLAGCETAAVGRALANLGFTGARRPSREELAKVARLRKGVDGRQGRL